MTRPAIEHVSRTIGELYPRYINLNEYLRIENLSLRILLTFKLLFNAFCRLKYTLLVDWQSSMWPLCILPKNVATMQSSKERCHYAVFQIMWPLCSLPKSMATTQSSKECSNYAVFKRMWPLCSLPKNVAAMQSSKECGHYAKWAELSKISLGNYWHLCPLINNFNWMLNRPDPMSNMPPVVLIQRQ